MNRVITKRDVIRRVSDRWEKQYSDKFGNVQFQSLRPDIVLKRLRELNLDTCYASEVDKVIGNSTWTELVCDQCKHDVDKVIEVGQPPDYDSATAQLCEQCVKSALESIQSEK